MLPRCRARGLAVTFPAPYDAEHTKLPAVLRERGRSLVTRRLMVMDRCEGTSLSKVGKRLLRDFAASRGQSSAHFEREMKERMIPFFVRCSI